MRIKTKQITPMKKQSNIYIIKQYGDYYKIGVSNNINKRIKSIQTSSPVELELIAYLPSNNNKEAIGLERKIHKEYRLLNTHLEWFKLPDNTLTEIINKYHFLPGNEYKEQSNDYSELIKKCEELDREFYNPDNLNKQESLDKIIKFDSEMFKKLSASKYRKTLRECLEYSNLAGIPLYMSLDPNYKT